MCHIDRESHDSSPSPLDLKWNFCFDIAIPYKLELPDLRVLCGLYWIYNLQRALPSYEWWPMTSPITTSGSRTLLKRASEGQVISIDSVYFLLSWISSTIQFCNIPMTKVVGLLNDITTVWSLRLAINILCDCFGILDLQHGTACCWTKKSTLKPWLHSIYSSAQHIFEFSNRLIF